jgi:hypothetical protein
MGPHPLACLTYQPYQPILDNRVNLDLFFVQLDCCKRQSNWPEARAGVIHFEYVCWPAFESSAAGREALLDLFCGDRREREQFNGQPGQPAGLSNSNAMQSIP